MGVSDVKRHGGQGKRDNFPQGMYCRGRIWIEKEGETYLGYGRMVLLSRIGEFGSIVQAAKSMQMSYKAAWDLVNDMNRRAPAPLVIARKGGRGGGGAVLSPTGEAAIIEFRALQQRLEDFLAAETENLRNTAT